jgi:lambda family phage tail tape measure protein
MINGISKLIDYFKDFFKVISQNAALQKLGSMLAAAGQAIDKFMNSTVTLGSTSGTVWQMIGTAVAVAAEIVINAFGWLIDGLAGVYQAWSGYMQQVVALWQGFFATGVGKFLIGFMKGVVNAMIGFVKVVGTLIFGIPKFFFQAFGAAGKIANSFFSRLKSLLSGNVGAFSGFWQEAAAAAQVPMESIRADVSAIGSHIQEVISNTSSGAITGMDVLDRMTARTAANFRTVREAARGNRDMSALDTSPDAPTGNDTSSNSGSDRSGADAERDRQRRLKEFQDRVKSLTETYMPAIAKQRELSETMEFFASMTALGNEGLAQYGLTLEDVALMAERANKSIMESVGSKALDDLAFEAGTIQLSRFSDVQSTVEQQFREIKRAAEDAHEVIDAGLEAEIRARLTANEEARRAVDAAKELADANKALRENAEQEVQSLRDRISLMGVYGEQADRAADLLDFRRATERSGADIATQAAAIRDYTEAVDALAARRQELNTFSEGAKRALTEYADSARDIAGRAYDAISGITDGLTSAFEEFYKTGKFGMKDFLKTIADEMARFAAKGTVMLFFKLFSSMMGGGGIGSLFGGFFADGGQPPVGKVSVVGEKGPELFVPRTAGTVIPHNQSAAMMSGGRGSTTFAPHISISISGSNWTPADADALGTRIVNDVMEKIINEQRPNGVFSGY